METQDEWLARSTLKYVLYARKSTVSDERQDHSISDQIKDCQKLAEQLGNIHIVEIIKEQQSARYAGGRPEFSRMLDGIKKGKYDGIISYHPDRLARNMLDAGILMDMLKPDKGKDEAVLKDLLFANHTFHNDDSGALTLAISFAMATNYSDNLKTVIKRGVKSHFGEGKSSGEHKWGYIRSTQGYYVPNRGSGDNFDDIREMFLMLLDGKTQAEIVDYCKRKNIHYMTKGTPKNPPHPKYLGSSSSVSRLLHDPFYHGILVQANQEIDLKTLPEAHFVPMLSEDEWEAVQAQLHLNNMKKSRTKRLKAGKHEFYYPFRKLIHCGSCGNTITPFSVQKTTKNGEKYRLVYYKCSNPDCPRKNTIRGQDIVRQLCNFTDHLQLTSDAYKEYKDAIIEHTDVELVQLRKQRASLVAVKSNAEKRQKEENECLKHLIMNKASVPQSTIDASVAKVEEQQDIIVDADAEIREITAKLNRPEDILQSEEEFLNLVQTAAQQMRNGNFVTKDILARKLFSNLILDEKNKLSVSVNPDLEGLILVDNSLMVEQVG